MLIRCGNCFERYDEGFEACPHCGYVEGDPPGELYHLHAGTVLRNRYAVGKVLGFGGFGITYKVRDRNLEVVLAVKEYYPSGLVNRIPGSKNVILFTGSRTGEYNHGLLRFLDEAKSMARFGSHKSIINVFEYFEENNTAYIVMEYLDGVTLSDFLKNNSMDVDSCVEVVQRVCAALKDIHKAGIVHRDVSPDNIFLCTNGAIKLIDFGAARFASSEESRMTIILKPGFAPPEQYNKVDIQGPWTDIYALGATMYLMITGVKPEESTNRKIADTLAAPSEIDPAIPAHISNTVMKAMAIDKHLRFSAIVDFEKALNQEKKVLPVAKEKSRRKRRRLAGVLAAVAVIIVSASIFWTNWTAEREAETLPDATIAMWYPLSGEDAADAAKAEAFRLIVETFNDSFPNVTIHVEAFEPEDYIAAVGAMTTGDEAPTLFESGDLDETFLKNTLDLSETAAKQGLAECYFLAEYTAYFPRKNQLPLAFTAPVLYINTSLTDFDGQGMGSAPEPAALSSQAEHALLIDPDCEAAFVYAFGETAPRGAVSKNAKDLFLNGKAAVFFSDSAMFFDVREALPAQYKLAYIDSPNILGEFADLWSLNACDADEQKAAERLLEYMLSDNAQDILCVRNAGRALPVNRSALGVFCEVYNDFSGFFENIDDYNFRTAG
jgi:serine/threonine protein kinase